MHPIQIGQEARSNPVVRSHSWAPLVILLQVVSIYICQTLPPQPLSRSSRSPLCLWCCCTTLFLGLSSLAPTSFRDPLLVHVGYILPMNICCQSQTTRVLSFLQSLISYRFPKWINPSIVGRISESITFAAYGISARVGSTAYCFISNANICLHIADVSDHVCDPWHCLIITILTSCIRLYR